MKLTVLGFGQCGGRIADEFERINNKARRERGMEIVPAVFAVNTDAADLSGLSYIPRNYRHRILIGGRRTGGHGIGKMNDLAAGIARQESDRIFDAIRNEDRAFESDAFLLIASGAGGTGSGAVSVTASVLKERYLDKPVYTLITLPFDYEEKTEERAIYNTALCLKAARSVSDAVFLVDNQRYVGRNSTLGNNFSAINRMIVEPFYDLLCAGEERNRKYIGSKTMDAADIMATLSGWTVIGYGSTPTGVFNFPFRRADFAQKSRLNQKGLEALDRAISDLSLNCGPVHARRALYLLSGPSAELNAELAEQVGEYLRTMLPKTTIRDGDYPRERANLAVHVILSELTEVEKVKDYYQKSVTLMPELKTRAEETTVSLKEIDDLANDLPSLV